MRPIEEMIRNIENSKGILKDITNFIKALECRVDDGHKQTFGANSILYCGNMKIGSLIINELATPQLFIELLASQQEKHETFIRESEALLEIFERAIKP